MEATYRRRRLCLGATPAAALVLLAVLFASSSPGASTEDRLDHAEAGLEHAEMREGVLTRTISRFDGRIDEYEGRLSSLRGREQMVREELAQKQAELDRARGELTVGRRRLTATRARLRRSLVVLRERVVAIYESGEPDILDVLVGSTDYDEMVARSEYLSQIQQQDETIVDRVRQLRDAKRSAVRRLRRAAEGIAHARDEIAAREDELASTRDTVEVQRGRLVAVRGERRDALSSVKVEADRFSSNIQALQQKIAEELREAGSGYPAIAAPTPGQASAAGLIWPVQGVLTSPFGPRWGSFHPGIDIGVSEGTPIEAAASGTVVLMQSEAESGGYGNYTCIDHGGGLSTCYAHQVEFATSLGARVEQGEVIGYVGNTGYSTGPHLHFEVRVNGEPVDPLGYL
ncbi:MAG: peptidoglycan DD-metalloendopeptidase family protein [Actinobacteria bacterium]|nr:peptidoglycan DD-metalloendopeptidase family protein [Actinomycetota bacterium]